VSRNASEPDSASLAKVGAASLPYVMKPDTGGEVMGASNRGWRIHRFVCMRPVAIPYDPIGRCGG